MNKIIRYLLLFFGSVFLLQYCTEEIDMEDYQHKIVVDGWIENGQSPIVALTISASYFATIDSTTIRDYVITAAKVTVSTDDQKEILTLTKNENYFPPYVYKGVELKGKTGKIYDLKVEYAGRVVTGTTSIPNPPEVDSIWFEFNETDTAGYFNLLLNDPPTENNYYRFFSKIENKDLFFIPTLLPNLGDKAFNGEQFTAPIYRGKANAFDPNDELYFKKYDSVLLKISTVDKAGFDFWLSFQNEVLNTGNPFASSNVRIASNIENGLGIWCGYNSKRFRVVAQ